MTKEKERIKLLHLVFPKCEKRKDQITSSRFQSCQNVMKRRRAGRKEEKQIIRPRYPDNSKNLKAEKNVLPRRLVNNDKEKQNITMHTLR